MHLKVLTLEFIKFLYYTPLLKALKEIRHVDLHLGIFFFLQQSWAHTGYIWMCLFSFFWMLHLAGRSRITRELPTSLDWLKLNLDSIP